MKPNFLNLLCQNRQIFVSVNLVATFPTYVSSSYQLIVSNLLITELLTYIQIQIFWSTALISCCFRLGID